MTSAGQLRRHTPVHLSGRVRERFHRPRQHLASAGPRTGIAADAGAQLVDVLPGRTRWTVNAGASWRSRGAAVLLLAVVVWSVQRSTAQSTNVAAPAGTAAAVKPPGEEKGAATEVDLTALETERPEPEESDRNPFRFKPKPAPPPPVVTETAAASRGRRRGASRASTRRAAAAPAHSAEVHRRNGRSIERGQASGDSERRAWRVPRPRRRSRRRALSNSEDRRRINRARRISTDAAAKPSDKQDNKRDMRRLTRVSALVLVLALLTGCAAGRAFSRGEDRARVGDWDSAVTYFRTAVQEDPDAPEYRIALERAMLNASRLHFDNARALEAKDQLDAALLEYRKTVEFDPGNTQALDRDRPAREDHPRPGRGLASQTRDRPAARAGAPGLGGAAAESRVARAARHSIQAGKPARHSHVHQQRHRHQRHLRRQLQRSPGDGPVDGLDRTGAQHAAVVERVVLHGARRAHDRRRAGYGAESAEVRAAGRADDSALVRGCDRDCRRC